METGPDTEPRRAWTSTASPDTELLPSSPGSSSSAGARGGQVHGGGPGPVTGFWVQGLGAAWVAVTVQRPACPRSRRVSPKRFLLCHVHFTAVENNSRKNERKQNSPSDVSPEAEVQNEARPSRPVAAPCTDSCFSVSRTVSVLSSLGFSSEPLIFSSLRTRDKLRAAHRARVHPRLPVDTRLLALQLWGRPQ